MTGMTPSRLRLRLRADPSRLTGFDGETALADARTRLRELRADVELAHLELRPPDAIGVVLLAGSMVSGESIVEIPGQLREILGIGPGADEWLPDAPGPVRGPSPMENIGPPGNRCPACGGIFGAHVPGCLGVGR